MYRCRAGSAATLPGVLTDEDAILREHWTRARTRWPDIELGEDDYLAHTRGHAGGRAEGAAKLHLEDLFLAETGASLEASTE